ncbi:hypothetical protein NBRC116594_33930 [Shimia sp. NS0008-38b]|uniref:peptidoglycan-binding domain-containing protein n=1 Tax=Shimia sp. NS0008-38b TaxID=3127653 RepID=UPI003109813E
MKNLDVCLVLDVAFVVKHPSLLTDTLPMPPNHVFQDAVDQLLDAKTILTATDWTRSSNSKSFRPPNTEDRTKLLQSIAAAHTLFHNSELAAVFDNIPEYIVASELLEHIHFGCVSGRFKTIVFASSLAANVILSSTALTDTASGLSYFERGNVSVSCTAAVSSGEEVKHHVRVQLRYENPVFFDSGDEACVALRQGLLAHEKYYSMPIDGLYGPETMKAEIDAAESLGVPSEDLMALYKRLSEREIAPRTRRRFK